MGGDQRLDDQFQSQAPYRLATPQWMSQIRAQDRPAPSPHMFGFPGSQVPIPEGSQVPTRKTERIRRHLAQAVRRAGPMVTLSAADAAGEHQTPDDRECI